MPEGYDEFPDFVRTRGDWLLRIAFLLVGDRHAAEDLLQDVLIGVHLRWDRIRESPEAYARGALVNRANSLWRWRRRRRETPLSDVGDPAAPETDPQPSSRAAIVRALGALSKRQRAVVVLRYLDELSIAEVAEALGCSEGAVKSHTARALAKLRDVLPAGATANGDLNG
jgi:RNA polymerase sigma-70 factor (sigma-E family)